MKRQEIKLGMRVRVVPQKDRVTFEGERESVGVVTRVPERESLDGVYYTIVRIDHSAGRSHESWSETGYSSREVRKVG